MKSIFLLAVLSACVTTKDIAQHARLPSGTRVNVADLSLLKLDQMKSGESCMRKFLFIPVSGDRSTYAAAKNGGIDKIQLISETRRWSFPMMDDCTIVYGDALDLPFGTASKPMDVKLDEPSSADDSIGSPHSY